MARNSYFNENTLEELLEEIKYVYQSDKRPWVIGYSGGKDSTTVVELVYKMLQMLPKEERNKNVYIVSSDTLIENPLIKIYLSKMNKLLGEAAKKDDLPIISTMVTPPADNSFWANVIGRGFPTPRINGTFRWCTDRLKINPSANYIRNVIKKEGEEVVVLLGVRKAESEARRRRIEGRELANRLMNRHETIQDAYVYNPIVELTTEDVWEVLLRLDGGKTPWGSNNNELVSLYAGADSGECPFAGNHGGQLYTLEHFIVPDNRNAKIKWLTKDEESIEISFTGQSERKKKLINYLIVEQKLNNDILLDFDVIKKIELISDYYGNATPKHVGIITAHIENMESYKELKKLKNEEDEKEVENIRNCYNSFLDEYFSDNNQRTILNKLLEGLKLTFINS